MRTQRTSLRREANKNGGTPATGRKGATPAAPRPAGETRTPGKVVGAVDGAIKILRYLSRAEQPTGVSRIAKDTGLNTSTAFNILRTLALHDLVHFDPRNKAYALSLSIMDIAMGATKLAHNIESARPALERIAHDYGLTLTLWQPVSKNRKVLVLSVLAPKLMRIQMVVGQRLPLFTGATGRIFAAFGSHSEAELKDCFDEIRWDKPLTFRIFKDQLKETRLAGWSMDDGNFAAGTISLAVPLLDRNGGVAMAVTATMFTGQFDKKIVKDIIRDLRQFAAQTSRVIAV